MPISIIFSRQSVFAGSLASAIQEHPNSVISKSMHDREGSVRPHGSVEPSESHFGFWLPHGLNLLHNSATASSDSIASRKSSEKRKALVDQNQRRFYTSAQLFVVQYSEPCYIIFGQLKARPGYTPLLHRYEGIAQQTALTGGIYLTR